MINRKISLLIVALVAIATVSSARIAPKNAPSGVVSAEDTKRYEGVFDFYYEAQTRKLLLEVGKLDAEFLYVGAVASGAGSVGEKGRASSYVVKFVRQGPKVFLVRPELGYRAVTDIPDELHSVETAFAKSVIWSFTPTSEA